MNGTIRINVHNAYPPTSPHAMQTHTYIHPFTKGYSLFSHFCNATIFFQSSQIIKTLIKRIYMYQINKIMSTHSILYTVLKCHYTNIIIETIHY